MILLSNKKLHWNYFQLIKICLIKESMSNPPADSTWNPDLLVTRNEGFMGLSNNNRNFGRQSCTIVYSGKCLLMAKEGSGGFKPIGGLKHDFFLWCVWTSVLISSDCSIQTWTMMQETKENALWMSTDKQKSKLLIDIIN